MIHQPLLLPLDYLLPTQHLVLMIWNKNHRSLGFFYLLLWLSCLLLWNYLTALIQRCTVPKLSFKNSQKGIYWVILYLDGAVLNDMYPANLWPFFLTWSYTGLHSPNYVALTIYTGIIIVSSSYSSPFLFFVYIMEKTWTTGVSETGEHMIISFFVWLVHW